jgi:hypothetical protein
MTWKINGIEVNEFSKFNGFTWNSSKRINNFTLNICYNYTLQNNNPPFPPQADITFNYTDCSENIQTVDVPSGGNVEVCALFNTVVDPPGGISTKGMRC